MKLIVGLGNPGGEYARTRHNIGLRLIESIAVREHLKFSFKKSKKAAFTSTLWNGETVLLAHPLTYMNLSGEAVTALVRHWKIASARDLLVVVDDVALPFGKFRLRSEGSCGGHNGLASIEKHLGSRAYPRLRIGIGACEPDGAASFQEPLRDYVLSFFKTSEEKKMKTLFEYGLEACRAWVLSPFSKAMNQVNAAGF